MHFDGTITLGPIITGVGLFISLVTSAYTYWRKYQDKNKPELIIYVDQLTAGTISKFLIIKNTGQIPAQIKGIQNLTGSINQPSVEPLYYVQITPLGIGFIDFIRKYKNKD